MNFPRFWAKGVPIHLVHEQDEEVSFSPWRWSNNSLEEAQALANTAAQQLFERFTKDGESPAHYGYFDRPLREQVLRELTNGAGQTSSVITRNAYGADILNCSGAMFLDVDTADDEAADRPPGLLARLFGKASTPAAPPRSPEKMLINKLETWLANHRDWNCRLYRTRAGFRLLATHALFDPETAASNGVFSALCVDPLYRRLCQVQKCFRARLTPKPWRCNSRVPPARWPWNSARDEARFNEWQKRYSEKCRNLATCSFLGAFGSNTVHPEVEPVIAHHDEATRAHSQLSLA